MGDEIECKKLDSYGRKAGTKGSLKYAELIFRDAGVFEAQTK